MSKSFILHTKYQNTSYSPTYILKHSIIFNMHIYAMAVFLVPMLISLLIPSANANPTAPKTLNVTLEVDTTIHVFIRPKEKDQKAKIYLCPADEKEEAPEDGQMIAECAEYYTDLWFDFFPIEHGQAGQFVLKWRPEETEMSYVYLFERESVLEEGIRIQYIRNNARQPKLTGSYHARTPIGWNSDPTGFGRSSDGHFHLFYQHFPHSLEWYTMHWGHMVSKDLINWVHLPIFMIPPNQQDWDHEYGHFTGSTVNLSNGGLGIIWTHRIINVPRNLKSQTKKPFSEVQKFVRSNDLIEPDWDSEKIIIDEIPEEDPPIGNSFRDPIVFLGPGGYYYLTIGQERKDLSGGVVLLYRNKNKNPDKVDSGWEYQGIIHEDGRDGLKMCECSALIPLGDPLDKKTLWVLQYLSDKGSGHVHGRDEENRERMTTLNIGNFDGKRFTPQLEEQKIDFVGGSSAYQGFYDPISKRSYAIGWVGDVGWIDWWHTVGWYNNPSFDGRSGSTTFTVPKEYVLSKNRDYLMVRPLPELAELRENNPIVLSNGKQQQLSKGTAELYFEFDWSSAGSTEEKAFELELEISHLKNGKRLQLRVDSTNGIDLKREWINHERATKQLVVRKVKPRNLRVFIDLDTVEYFFDDGRWAGTILIPNSDVDKRVQQLEFTASSPSLVKKSNMWYLNYKAHKSGFVPGGEDVKDLYKNVRRR